MASVELLDMSQYLGLDIEKEIIKKHEHNKTSRCPSCGSLTKQEHSTRVKNGLRKTVDSGRKLGRPKKVFNVDRTLTLLRMGYSYRGMERRIGVGASTIHRKVREHYAEKGETNIWNRTARN